MRNDFCSNYLEHSAKGTSWRKKGAKYLSRVWKNGRWVYEYKITGKGYLKDSNSYRQRAYRAARAGDKAVRDKDKNLYKAAEKQYSYYVDKDFEAADNWEKKSIGGRLYKATLAGERIIKDILSKFKTTETVTITSNLYPAGTKKVIKKK